MTTSPLVRADDLKPGVEVIVTLTEKDKYGLYWRVATNNIRSYYLPPAALIGVARLYRPQQPVDVEAIRAFAYDQPWHVRDALLALLPPLDPEPDEPTGDDVVIVDGNGRLWRRGDDGRWRLGSMRLSWAEMRHVYGPLTVYRRQEES